MRAIETEILRCGVSNGADLLIDLGCGTGKFTREILPFAKAEGERLVILLCVCSSPNVMSFFFSCKRCSGVVFLVVRETNYKAI